jgi:peptidyl-prolyl cis-trans isomerase D
MLKQIRGTMKSAVATLLAVPLVIAFAAWGVPEIRQFTQSYTVRVGKTGISALEIQTEFDRFATNQRLSGNEFNREAAIASGAHNQIVQSLAARTALDQESKQMGLSMPRDMVRNFLQTSDQFKNPRTGKFDNEALSGILREYNYGIRDFEDRLQSDLLRNQLMSSISGGEPAPKALVDALVIRESEERTVSYLSVTEDMAAAPDEPTDETLLAYYQKNASQFMAPEYRTFSAIILKNSDYAETISPSEGELRRIYDASLAKYQTPERRTVYQITFTDEESAKSATDALKGGTPFETVANENGKALEEVTLLDAQKKDILDPKVADAVFSVKDEGALVGPIKGVFGFTVAQVAAIKPAEVKSFEEVQAEIATETQSKDSKKKLFDIIEEIENQRDTGASLADAASKAGTIAIEYGPVDSYSFGSGGEIVAGVPGDVLREAFKLEEGEESDAVEFTDKSGYFFVSVNEIAPPSTISYEKVEAEIRDRWAADDRKERMAKVVKSLRDALASGKTLREAAEPLNRAPITETISRRSANQKFSPAISDQIFAADKGEAISGPAAAGNADVVLTVDNVAFDTAKVSPDDVAVFAQYVGRQIGQEIVDAYVDAVVSDADIKINQAQIDDIFSVSQ